jgi:hypothetical protein
MQPTTLKWRDADGGSQKKKRNFCGDTVGALKWNFLKNVRVTNLRKPFIYNSRRRANASTPKESQCLKEVHHA